MSIQHNIKWLGTRKVQNLQSPLRTVAHHKGDDILNVVIALHGFGDNAENFSSVSHEININNVLWLFPEGPKECSVAPRGAQWFPIYNNPLVERRASEDLILQLIYNVRDELNISLNKIFLMGFSQGGMMALNCGLKETEALAGVLSLSGMLIQSHQIRKKHPDGFIETPVFLAHGLQDQVVLPAMYFESLDCLKDLGVKKLRAKSYPMGHTLCHEEILDIIKFIEELR